MNTTATPIKLMQGTAIGAACILCRSYGRTPTTPTHGRVCDTDRTRVETVTVRLVELADAVPAALTPTRRGTGTRTPGPRAGTTPIRLDVLSLVGPGAEGVRGSDQRGGLPPWMQLDPWCAEIAEWTGDPQPGGNLAAQARLLHNNTDLLCDRHPHAPRIIETVERIVRRLDPIVGDTVRQGVGYCPAILSNGTACGARVTASVWDAATDCPRCKHRWPRSSWRGLPSRKPTTT